MAYYQFADFDPAKDETGSYEVFYMNREDLIRAGVLKEVNDTWFHIDEMNEWWPCEPNAYEGYYWWCCFPGCIPEGDLNGPYSSIEDAHADANA